MTTKIHVLGLWSEMFIFEEKKKLRIASNFWIGFFVCDKNCIIDTYAHHRSCGPRPPRLLVENIGFWRCYETHLQRRFIPLPSGENNHLLHTHQWHNKNCIFFHKIKNSFSSKYFGLNKNSQSILRTQVFLTNKSSSKHCCLICSWAGIPLLSTSVYGIRCHFWSICHHWSYS